MSENKSSSSSALVSNVMNNSGGPRSRVRTEEIHADFFTENVAGTCQGILSVKIPARVVDIEKWLKNCCKNFNKMSWDEIGKTLRLPDQTMMVFTINDYSLMKHLVKNDFIRSALILAKCNKHSYDPDSPFIFTRKRLDRCIKLIEINNDQFYALD